MDRRASAPLVALLVLLSACAQDAGVDSCPAMCQSLATACRLAAAPDGCEDQCQVRRGGKTATSIAEADECIRAAATCGEAERCDDDKLEDVPLPPDAGASGGGGGPGPVRVVPPGSASVAVGNLCDKAIQCEFAEPGERAECVDALTQILVVVHIMPDVSGFAACVQAAPCAELDPDSGALEDLVLRCGKLDPSRHQCEGDVLLVCNTDNVCARPDCRAVCDEVGGDYHHCGLSEESGNNVCFCER